MTTGSGLERRLDERLWPVVEAWIGANDVAGVAVAVVRDEEVVTRCFGVRDLRTLAPVTDETMFHLASVSKPFVATAVVSLAMSEESSGPRLDLDAPVTEWVPELTLADGRASEVTLRGLLTHTSGLPDVTEYGWHDPRLADDSLVELALSMSEWRLQSDPGSTFSYSNAGYELLGLVLSRVLGTTFEEAVRRLVLTPMGMERSTFLRSEVPVDLAASPHVGMPLAVPGDAYPYTRRHAPSSTLHSNLVELTRWIGAHWQRLDARVVDLMRRPAVQVGEPPWDDAASLGWGLGTYDGRQTLSHSGADPGFGSRVTLMPEERVGVVVLANANTVPTGPIPRAALEVVLDGTAGEVEALRALLPPVAGPVARTLAGTGEEDAEALFRTLTEAETLAVDPDDDGFVDAVWGAIELHRTAMVWPLLRLWTDVRPESADAWTMTGWAHRVDGDYAPARAALQRALEIDPDHDEAASILRDVPG